MCANMCTHFIRPIQIQSDKRYYVKFLQGSKNDNYELALELHNRLRYCKIHFLGNDIEIDPQKKDKNNKQPLKRLLILWCSVSSTLPMFQNNHNFLQI